MSVILTNQGCRARPPAAPALIPAKWGTPPMPTNFGNWLKDKREAARMSQQQVAANAGMAQSKVSDIERLSGTKRERSVDRDEVIALARAVGASIAEAQTVAGYIPRVESQQMERITDPDAIAIAEAYQGLSPRQKETIRNVVSAAEIATQVERSRSIGRITPDEDQRETGQH